MKQIFLIYWIMISGALLTDAFAQKSNTELTAEIGIQVGAAHYFGDLNTTTGLKKPYAAIGVFVRKQIDNYTALRLAANYTKLGYSDKLQSDNEFQRRRNLDFETRILELLVQGDFNFFKFNPTAPGQRFSPYLTFGVGMFYYNPYTTYGGIRYNLRSLGTEGQQSSQFPDKKEYGNIAVSIPVGFGVKWSVNNKITMHFELTHRFTTTDYLDDVSGTYAGSNAFLSGSIADLLQDRSYETGTTPIGRAGSQRGFSANKDQFIIANLGFTLNFSRYQCPTGF
ncbi:MAG: hypothetical protein KGP35_01590 [Bacteroidetes bacterium]|nr:hypothetical protein [Bacteroidota bacterium]